MNKRKIAIFGLKFWPSQGGTSRVVEDIILQLKDEFEFTVYCYEHPDAASNIPGVKTIQFPKPPMGGAGVFYFFYKCCLHIMQHGKYDFVHVHKTDASFFLPYLTRKYTCIATSHEAPYRRDKWTIIGRTYFQIAERIFMNSQATLTSISKPLSVYYEDKYNKPVIFIPNGVDTNVEPDFDAAQSILDQHNVPDTFILFAARRIMSTKGCHTVLKAMKKINYTIPIVIAGDTTQLPNYTKQLEQLSEGISTHFVGYVNSKEKLLALVKKAKLFMFPSEAEGMSIMLLEVASMGTPIICSDIPENTNVFEEEEVLFFENKNVDDLAHKLSYAEGDMEDMYQRAEKAKRKVLHEYSREKVAQKYAALYKEVIHNQLKVV